MQIEERIDLLEKELRKSKVINHIYSFCFLFLVTIGIGWADADKWAGAPITPMPTKDTSWLPDQGSIPKAKTNQNNYSNYSSSQTLTARVESLEEKVGGDEFSKSDLETRVSELENDSEDGLMTEEITQLKIRVETIEQKLGVGY